MFFSCAGKELYRMCVLILNKKTLDKRVDTPWRSVLKIGDEVRPEWRVLYKPPLSKRTGDSAVENPAWGNCGEFFCFNFGFKE